MEAYKLLPEYPIFGWTYGIGHAGNLVVEEKEVPISLWLPWIAVFGGFLFSILWEAKSRYVFPYCVFMILYAPEGLYQTGLLLCKLPKLRKFKRADIHRIKEKKHRYERLLKDFLASFSCLLRMRSSSKKVFSI